MTIGHITAALDALAGWLKQETGLATIYDPQPVKSAEPHIRLTLTGTTDRGDGPIDATFQLTIVGAGDGPDVFLPMIIKASASVTDLYNRCLHDGCGFVEIPAGTMAVRALFPDIGLSTGQFVQQDVDPSEQSQWRYVYTEPHNIILTIPR